EEVPPRQPITKGMLYALGFSGGERSAVLRRALLKRLELPEGIGANARPGVLTRLVSPAQLEELALSAPAVGALMDLVLDFQERFSREKARRGVLDFSDLEHFAVKLLTGGEGKPSDLARYWGARYDEVLVDEYQDTNAVQNAIFAALSQGDNLFLVGDVKQSIYRFRLADPSIFLDKYRRFPDGDRAAEGEARKR
ncbi:DUF4093 domain-containing protein, partial [uncultured Oscillibacter sp.]|uniref:DUF4093 domain-containing protein n=1 Tax=uncultured Oscillibacter sp. TaxID=876091 RepID=UPI00261B26E7